MFLVFFFNISERTKVTRKTRAKHEAETEGLKNLTFIHLTTIISLKCIIS
jgi:hypothetical protein